MVLEESMAPHSSILAWRIPMNRGAWRAIVHGVTKSQTGLNDQAQHSTVDIGEIRVISNPKSICGKTNSRLS